MSNLFCRSCRKPLVTMRTKMQKVLCLTASNTHSSKSFLKTFEQKKSTRRVLLFASAFSVPLLHPPPCGTYLSKATDIAGPQWQLGGRPPSASLFSEFGVGAPNGQRIITVWLFARKKCWSQNCRDRIR